MSPDDLLAVAHAAPPGVFVCLTPDRAAQEYEASRQRHARGEPLGPLDGVRVTWKDLFDVAGVPTRCGSRLTPARPARTDAAAVARLRAAGAVCIGKTVLSEFAFSGLGMNPHFGTPRNPALPPGDDRVCGGSSSGAAAAVALGLCEVAVATDTSGSARVPASFTGVAGFRASRRRYPGRGVWRLAPSLDTIGLLARTVARLVDADAVLAAAPAPPAQDPRTVTFMLHEPSLSDCSAAVRARTLAFAARLEAAGCPVEVGAFAPLRQVKALFEQHGTLVAAEAAQAIGHWLDGGDADLMDPRVRERLERARARFSLSALRVLRAAQRDMAMQLAEPGPVRRVLVLPTTPDTAPTLESLRVASAFHAANDRALSLTMPLSFCDMATLSVPSGRDERGAPTGVQLAVAAGHDGTLLALARRLEEQGIISPLPSHCMTSPSRWLRAESSLP